VKTLLLDKLYKPIAFLSLKKMTRLVMTNKAEVIVEWPNVPFYKGMNYPAIIRLDGPKAYIRKKPVIPRFNFKGIFRRDRFYCQYTGVVLHPSQLTVDHIIPKARGGKSTWENCVTASLTVNANKGNRTPEEAGLKLLAKPIAPKDPLALEYSVIPNPHPDWADYFPGVINGLGDISPELERIAS
jgi:5-methylcytosine-specific restriction endonuclease McrA